MDKQNLILVYGGRSAEHEISVATAGSVVKAVDFSRFNVRPIYICKSGNWLCGDELAEPELDLHLQDVDAIFASNQGINIDVSIFNENKSCVVFPLLHGTYGEDGTVQGLLELLNVPYVGCGVLASALAMDKALMKTVFSQLQLLQASYLHFLHFNWVKDKDLWIEKIEKELGYPCFVKPANLGSSVGINRCINRQQLHKAINTAFSYDRKVIVEEGIVGREIEMGVIGNDNIECSVAGELQIVEDFYSYESKYKNGNTTMVIPAELTTKQYTEMQRMARCAYRALDCAGMARIDFFVHSETGEVYINEINTIPGFTPASMFPQLWKQSGLGYTNLIEKLVDLAMEKNKLKKDISVTYDSK